jgi:hypothetical protein
MEYTGRIVRTGIESKEPWFTLMLMGEKKCVIVNKDGEHGSLNELDIVVFFNSDSGRLREKIYAITDRFEYESLDKFIDSPNSLECFPGIHTREEIYHIARTQFGILIDKPIISLTIVNVTKRKKIDPKNKNRIIITDDIDFR